MNAPGRWEALAVHSVRKEHVQEVLAGEGWDWSAVSHVPATGSLAHEFRMNGDVAVDIATIIDLIVMLGRGGALASTARRHPESESYNPDDPGAFEAELRAWRRGASTRRVDVKIKFADKVRDCIRDGELGMSAPAARIFDSAVHEFAWTLQALIASGMHPAHMDPRDEIGSQAKAIWKMLEDGNHIPDFTAVRDDLWMDANEFASGKSPEARDLADRMREVLSLVCGQVDGRRTIVWHGFHFFTPVQWRLFQMLRRVPGIDQLFIVHDDGESAAFETWRRYFSQRLMPVPRPAGPLREPAVPAAEFRRALAGEMVDGAVLSGRLSVVKCRTPAEFVSHWRMEQPGPAEYDRPTRTLFAAGAAEIERVVGRFSGFAGDASVDLAQIPVGAFLLALHDCMHSIPGKPTEIRFTERHLVDIVSSGMLDLHSTRTGHVELTAAFRRSLPYFRGCGTAEEWIRRAEDLATLVSTAVTSLGERTERQFDAERIALAAENPLRLVPWADISVREAEDIVGALKEIAEIVSGIASAEKQNIDDHLERIKPRLLRGMQNLSEEHRAELEEKFEALGAGIEDEVYVKSLVEVVHMLLRREADFGFSGDGDADSHKVRHLRSLDVLGFVPSARDVHVANLADGVYPGRVSPIGWPFRMSDFAPEAEGTTLDLLQLRSDTSSVSDMYLLWLALDGVTDGAKVTLSWIENVGSEIRNPSPLLTLLIRPASNRKGDSVPARVGGVSTVNARVASVDDEPTEPVGPAPRGAGAPGLDAVGVVDVRALASAHLCARRFVLQWALGPSAAWQAGHHQMMTYGNTRARLVQEFGMTIADATRVCDSLWQHVTEGERASSLLGRRVYDEERAANGKWMSSAGEISARPEFALTINGRMNKSDRAVDRAYTSAANRIAPPTDVVFPVTGRFLPPRPDIDEDVCFLCPVRDRCLAAAEPG